MSTSEWNGYSFEISTKEDIHNLFFPKAYVSVSMSDVQVIIVYFRFYFALNKFTAGFNFAHFRKPCATSCRIWAISPEHQLSFTELDLGCMRTEFGFLFA